MLSDLGVRRMRLSQYGYTMYNGHDDSYFLSSKSAEWLNIELEKIRTEFPGCRITFNYIPNNSVLNDIEEKKEKFENRAMCTGGVWAFVVSGSGKVIPCDEIPVTDENVLGDLRTQTIQEVWDSPKVLRFTAPFRDLFAGTVCYECEEFDECHQGKGRCYRDALKVYGSLFAPCPSCWRAPIGRRTN